MVVDEVTNFCLSIDVCIFKRNAKNDFLKESYLIFE